MLFIVLYLGTRNNVCVCNCLRDMTINSFLWPLTFTCDLQPSVKITRTLIIRCASCCFMLALSMTFVGSIEMEIWTIVLRKQWTSQWSLIPISWHLIENLPSACLCDIPNFILIGHKRALIHSSEVNKELWRITDFNMVQVSAISSR